MDWMSFAFKALQLVPSIQNDLKSGVSVESLKAVIGDPQVWNAFDELGQRYFPHVVPELKAAAVIATSYDPDRTKWVQNVLNGYLVPSPRLVVDGVYGPATIGAVRQAQEQLGITVDGYVGNQTMKFLAAVFTKAPAPAPSPSDAHVPMPMPSDPGPYKPATPALVDTPVGPMDTKGEAAKPSSSVKANIKK